MSNSSVVVVFVFVDIGSSAECYIRAKPTQVNYQLDSASFIELKKRSNWKSYLDQKIKTHRTSSLRIR